MRHTHTIRLSRFESPLHKDGLGARAVYDTPDGMIVVDLPTRKAEANAELFASAPQLACTLAAAVREALAAHQASVESADAHNNSDGVGQRFDYRSPDPLPAWVERAMTLLAPLTHGNPVRPLVH